MATKHYTVKDGSLVQVKADEFVKDGSEVIRVVVSDQETHLIAQEVGDGFFASRIENGVLNIVPNGPSELPLRHYGTWLYADVIDFTRKTASAHFF